MHKKKLKINEIADRLEVVLYHPQIPQNTGNIGRLCVNTGIKLNLIKPIGFSLEEKYIRRAGLDYWPYLDLKIYESWENFLEGKDRNSLFFFSTKGKKTFWDCPYTNIPILNTREQIPNPKYRTRPSYLIFGSETSGLSKEIYEEYAEQLYTIPMYGKHSRSYNLSNSVALVLFEGIRKLKQLNACN